MSIAKRLACGPTTRPRPLSPSIVAGVGVERSTLISGRGLMRAKVLNARADEKGDCGAARSGKRSGKSKSAGAAFGWVLFREPERVDGKIRAAKTKKEKANEKPG